MSHSVHPYAHRLGVLWDWKSRWFAGDDTYKTFLKQDVMLREYLSKRLRGMYVDSVEMERGRNTFRIVIKTSRPGMLIGRGGEGSQKLRADIMKELRRIDAGVPADVRVDIEEVRTPETHAAIVAYMIAEQLEKRLPFKRAMKQTIEKVMANKAVKGVRVTLSGRLGGAEMGRVETLMKGRLPLQTLRADIDFARERAHLSYGEIGIKVWIYKGEVFAERKARIEQ